MLILCLLVFIFHEQLSKEKKKNDSIAKKLLENPTVEKKCKNENYLKFFKSK